MQKNTIWRLWVNYGDGWECEAVESSQEEILAIKEDFEKNCPGFQTRITKG